MLSGEVPTNHNHTIPKEGRITRHHQKMQNQEGQNHKQPIPISQRKANVRRRRPSTQPQRSLLHTNRTRQGSS